MIRPMQLVRLLQINVVLIKHGLNRPVIGQSSTLLRWLSYLNPWSFFKNSRSRGESMRLALESLGPIFVKFGQLLSTRRDLLPDDIAEELAKLQDQVPPFSGVVAKKLIESAYGKSITASFAEFEEKPLASASIAQVHAARLHDGSEVVVKVLRPNINKIIEHDIALMYFAAELTERFWKQGRRLKLVEVVAEFEQTIMGELDLMREAANASQLRRNFQSSTIMYVPKIYWDYARRNVMVMERIYGIRISDLDQLRAANTDFEKLAQYGVEIFFTQVLRDSFFHADMHPGNVFVDVSNPLHPRYLGVDFGIMGSLSPQDQRYIAENLLAFFRRDYRQVAVLHVESGWVPADTRVDQFEAAIRAVCEPIFEKPLKDISFGELLLRLFQTADQFHMEIQPQLLLLQKTLLSIEGLGKQLYPDLDLWKTAKPFLEKWMRSQRGVRGLMSLIRKELPYAAEIVIKAPRMMRDLMTTLQKQPTVLQQEIERHQLRLGQAKKRSFLLGAGLVGLIGVAASVINKWPSVHFSLWQWVGVSVASLLLFSAMMFSRQAS